MIVFVIYVNNLLFKELIMSENWGESPLDFLRKFWTGRETIETPEVKEVKNRSRKSRDTLVQDALGKKVERLIWKEGIKAIQRHFKMEETGVYGRELSQKVAQFQHENWLWVDGVAGNKTLQKIQEKMTKEAPQEKWFFERLFSGSNAEPEKTHVNEKPLKTEKVGTIAEQNKQFISENIPYGWKDIALKSLRHLRNNEVYTTETPLLLFNSKTSRWVLIYRWENTEFPISISWYGTLQREMSKAWDHKTPTDWLQRFKDVYIAPKPDADASRSRKWADRWVTSARIESYEAENLWQRWVHGMGKQYINSPSTIGCIAIDNDTIRPIAQNIKTALNHGQKAYWYTA